MELKCVNISEQDWQGRLRKNKISGEESRKNLNLLEEVAPEIVARLRKEVDSGSPMRILIRPGLLRRWVIEGGNRPGNSEMVLYLNRGARAHFLRVFKRQEKKNNRELRNFDREIAAELTPPKVKKTRGRPKKLAIAPEKRRESPEKSLCSEPVKNVADSMSIATKTAPMPKIPPAENTDREYPYPLAKILPNVFQDWRSIPPRTNVMRGVPTPPALSGSGIADGNARPPASPDLRRFGKMDARSIEALVEIAQADPAMVKKILSTITGAIPHKVRRAMEEESNEGNPTVFMHIQKDPHTGKFEILSTKFRLLLGGGNAQLTGIRLIKSMPGPLIFTPSPTPSDGSSEK